MTKGNYVYVQREENIKGTCHANCEMAAFGSQIWTGEPGHDTATFRN